MKKFLVGLTLLALLATTFPILGSAAVFTFFIECKECTGSGRCSNCYGIGRIIEEYPNDEGIKCEHDMGPCEVCDGTGKCQKCNGSGKVPVSSIK